MPVSSVSFPTTGQIKENGLLEKARVDDNLKDHTILYTREFFDPVELTADNAKVGSLWVRIRGRPTRLITWQESATDHPARKK